MKKRTESQLTTACLQYLQCHENLGAIRWVDRLNSGYVYAKKGKSVYRVLLCRPGTSDIFFITKKGRVVWVENKSAKGKLTEDQVKFRDMIVVIPNHSYWVIRDMDVLVEKLEKLLEEEELIWHITQRENI